MILKIDLMRSTKIMKERISTKNNSQSFLRQSKIRIIYRRTI